MPTASLHPVLRYLGFLLPVVVAGALLLLSVSVAAHSLPWLVAICVLTGLFLAALRLPRQTELRLPFVAYAGFWCLYLINVWYLHVDVPREDIQATQARVDFVARFICLGTICVPVIVYSFALRIARLDRAFFRWIEWLGWALALFFCAASLAGRFVENWHWSGTVWVPTLDGLYGVFSLFAPVYVLLGWCAALVRVFTAPSRRWRLQLVYYLIGFVPFSLACLSHFLISSGMRLHPVGGWLFILHFAIVAYAVWVHRLYDVTVILRRSLAYALVSLAMGLLYATALWASASLAGAGEGGVGAALLFVLAAGLLITPLLAHVQRLVDRAFARDDANRREALEVFSSRMATCIREEDVCDPLCQVLLASLKTRAVRLFLCEENGELRLAGQDLTGRTTAEPSPAAVEYLRRKWADAGHAMVVVGFGPQDRNPLETIQMTEGQEHLIVPVRHRDRLLGGLLIEPKIADDPFFPDDRRFAEAAAAQAGVALVNARSFARIRHLQELTRQTIDGMTAAVVLMDQDGRPVLSNPAARSLLGLPDGDGASATAWSDLRNRQPVLADWLGQCIQEGGVRLNSELHLDGSERRFLLGNAHPLTQTDGEQRLTLFLFSDLTEYRTMEERLRRQEYLVRTGTMIAAINHEIGNILQPIQTQVRKLGEGSGDEAAKRKSVELLHDRTEALARLLRNLKDFARPIELRIRAVDVEELTKSVIQDVNEQHKDERLLIEMQMGEEAKTCQADGYWLRQVLYNLVRNAVEATAGRENRRVRILSRFHGAHIELSVEDNGPGIASAVKGRLFEPFASTKAETGTGLGLSLCRKIVDLHDGILTVESQEGAGARFTIRLPTPSPQDTLQPSAHHSTGE
jgi:signal transduction histidine kinase